MLPVFIDDRERLLLELTQDPTPTQIAEMISLWDQHSGLPGLLHANHFRFDQGRFFSRSSGRELDPQAIRRAVDKVATEVSLQMRKTTQQLLAGSIIFIVWYRRVRNMMRTLYRTIWLLSIGGLLFDDDLERNAFYLFIISQFNYFENLAFRIYVNDIPMNGQVLNYVGNYGLFGRSLWENLKLRTAKEFGKTQGRRVLGYNEYHCRKRLRPDSDRPGCVELAALGWIPIQQVIPIGDAICYNNCHCHIEVR